MKKLSIELINFYQKFSPFVFAGVCQYEVTCSQYTKQAISRYGTLKGILMGIKRIWSCR